MNKKMIVVSVLVAGMGASSLTMANPVCEAQKAAAADLIDARNSNTSIADVNTAIDKNASSEASANVLKASVEMIYADKELDVDAASTLIEKNCLSELGA